MARRFLIVALVSSFALIAPILSVNVPAESGQRSLAIDELQSKFLIANHMVCTKAWKGVCIRWGPGAHAPGGGAVRG
jgi:hypothetical protein